MIKKLICILLLAFPMILSAQETEGHIRYLITHNWTKKMAAVDYVSKQQKERLAYIWGSRSEWKMFTDFYFNADETKYEESEESAVGDGAQEAEMHNARRTMMKSFMGRVVT